MSSECLIFEDTTKCAKENCIECEYGHTKVTKEVDNVNHPQHYEGHTSLECIEVMKLIFGEESVGNFCLCNAFKYMWRYKNKNGEEDIKKALWYLRYVEHLIDIGEIDTESPLLIAYHRFNSLYIDITDKIANHIE